MALRGHAGLAWQESKQAPGVGVGGTLEAGEVGRSHVCPELGVGSWSHGATEPLQTVTVSSLVGGGKAAVGLTSTLPAFGRGDLRLLVQGTALRNGRCLLFRLHCGFYE